MPVAARAAPVSVAMSISSSGVSSSASASASARIRRPSASVLPISTVRPLRLLKTSPGRNASPETEFPTAGINSRNCSFSFAPITMRGDGQRRRRPRPYPSSSVSMPEDGLISRPPVSKQTPLPTRVTRGAFRIAPAQIDQAGRARRTTPDRFDQREILLERGALDHRHPGAMPRRQRPRRRCQFPGPMSLAGVLIRSRARKTASAMREISSPSTPVGRSRRGAFFFDGL